MVIKGVFFDFYGTLYILKDMEAELEEWITELYLLMKKCGLAATRNNVRDYYHKRMLLENPPKPDNGMTIFERRIEIVCSDFEVKMSRSEIEQAAEALLAVWDKYASLDPECLPLLSSLKKLGLTTALISNYDHPRHVHKLVRDSGMGDYFSAVIVSGDHGIKKPDPLIFRMALEKTLMNAQEIIYVGDSAEDVLGANKADLISVLIDRNGHGKNYGQRYIISSLSDVLKFVADR